MSLRPLLASLLRLPGAKRHALTLFCLFGFIVSTQVAEPLAAQLWEPAGLERTIGRLDGDDSEVFSMVRTIEVDATGNIYILDEQTTSIHVFDRNGDHITSYRRRGQGPGELFGIRGSNLDSEGVLHIADLGNARISAFELDGDSLAFRSETQLTFFPEDTCVLGRRRYVLHRPFGPPGTPTISEIDEGGRVVRRFARAEEPKNVEQRREMGQEHMMLNWGFIACDETTRTIVKFNQYVPIVRDFNPEGGVLWVTTLEGYVPWRFWRNRRGCCSYGPNPDESFSHSGRSVVIDRRGNVVLGLQVEGPRIAQNRRHELLVLDAASGRVIERHRTVGAAGAVRDGLIFTYGEEPFPQVRVFSAAAMELGAQGTPTILINGVMSYGVADSLELDAAIRRAIP